MISIRAAKDSDRDWVLAVRNEPAILRASGKEKPLTAEEHNHWWENTASSRSYQVFIAEHLETRIGAGHLTWPEAGEVEISLFISQVRRGWGFGSYFLDLLVEQARIRGAQKISARILCDNWRSIRLFHQAGFKPRKQDQFWDLA